MSLAALLFIIFINISNDLFEMYLSDDQFV